MNITEIYNMKVNMGLLDLKKYNNLINEIENVPQKYIDVFDLKNIGNKLKEELKLNNTMDLDEIVELYSQVIFNLHSTLGNTLSELEFKFNQIRIQARLNALKNPQKEGFDLNKSIDFKDLDSDILNLINLAYNGVKYMAKAMQINILAVSDNDAIERVSLCILNCPFKNSIKLFHIQYFELYLVIGLESQLKNLHRFLLVILHL